jgi:putative transcriptional regulator
MPIYCRLREIMEQRGLKQKFVAEKARVSYPTFNILVNNRALPTLEVAYRIGEALDLNVEEIWIRVPEKTKKPDSTD